MAKHNKRELDEIINRLRFQLKAIIRKLNIRYQYIDSEDLYQEALLYLWQQNVNGQLKGKNDSYILQGCYYNLRNYIRKNIKFEDKQINNRYSYSKSGQSQEVEKDNQLYNKNIDNHDLDEYLYYDEFEKSLSFKEKSLLNLRIRGLSTREIGKELGISHTMVSKLRKKIMDKYQSSN